MIKEIMVFEIYDFEDLKQFCWSGALDTLETIEKKDLQQEFIDLLNDLINTFENGMPSVALNDFIWFENEYIETYLNIEL